MIRCGSGAPFLLLGLFGLARLPRVAEAWRGLVVVLCTGLLLTFAGSGLYHLAPGNTGLLLDRLGMLVLFAGILGLAIDEQGAVEIARRARGTPRIANRLLRRVRDFAEVRGTGHISRQIADQALNLLDVDEHGFDHLDRRLLLAMIDKFDGGPVGIDSLAAAISEERGTIEDVLEPYLIQQGLLQRTPRGRVATLAAYEHFGLEPRGRGAGLFDE